MPMEEALVARLVAAAPVFALAGARISWFGFQRGDAGPQIALSKLSVGEGWTHDGPDGLDEPRVRFDVRGGGADQVLALKRAVIAEMHAGSDSDDIRFHPARLEAEREIPQGEQPGGADLLQWQLEFMFFFEEIDP